MFKKIHILIPTGFLTMQEGGMRFSSGGAKGVQPEAHAPTENSPPGVPTLPKVCSPCCTGQKRK